MANEANVGGFIAETASILRLNLTEAGIYVAVVGGLAAVGIVFGWTEAAATAVGLNFNIDAEGGSVSALYEIGLAVANLVGSYLLLRRFLAHHGRSEEGGSPFWPFVGMWIISWLGIVVGFILLIVPGVILLVRWSAASGFLLGRREGVIDSLGASWEATRGHSWSIFLAAIVMLLATAIAGGVVGGVFGAFGDLTGVASAFVEAAAGAVFMAFGIAIYSLVRHDTGDLAETFA
jgi:hypothetical protein